jgi:hypothetical protein
MNNNSNQLAKKLLVYYLITSAVLIFAFTIYKQAPLFKFALQGDRSFAADSVTVEYSAVQAFNQLDGKKDVYNGADTAWMGGDTQAALGLQFNSVSIPQGANLTSASIKVTANAEAWIGQSMNLFAEKNSIPQPFSDGNLPLSRTVTTASVKYSENTKWTKDSSYSLPNISSILSEVLPAGASQNVNIIVKGTGGKYARKFVYGTSSTKGPKLVLTYSTSANATVTPVPNQATPTIAPTAAPTKTAAPTSQATKTPIANATSTPMPMPTGMSMGDESMALMAWRVGGKNSPNLAYDKCDDGTDVVKAHNQYYVVAYDGIKYPTWHPPVVTNPVTGVGKCYFGHEHGTNPQGYQYWDEIVNHFGKDLNGDGTITKMAISSTGVITPGDRAGIPFGIANEKMDQYYNKENRDSVFVRHEDHVGHKIEFVNGESDMVGNTTHVMQPINSTGGVNIPFTKGTDYNTYYPTGVKCTHFHEFHQGTHSGDAIKNNLHEVIFHSNCSSTRKEYPSNTILLTGMMTFGDPAEYVRFCADNRSTVICSDGKDANGKCIVNDPLISKLPKSVYSNTLGRNMVDKYCLENIEALTKSKYFNPYEIWQGDLRISSPTGKMLAEHGRQWDVLDPIRYVDLSTPTGFGYNSQQCGPGGLLYNRTASCGSGAKNTAWDSPQSPFKGLVRTAYFGRNRVSNSGGSQIYWSDPLGGNAVTSAFNSGLKQKFSSVEADICRLPECSRLNDRAIQRRFDSGNGTVHAPN